MASSSRDTGVMMSDSSKNLESAISNEVPATFFALRKISLCRCDTIMNQIPNSVLSIALSLFAEKGNLACFRDRARLLEFSPDFAFPAF
jgi:hypothetical protein